MRFPHWGGIIPGWTGLEASLFAILHDDLIPSIIPSIQQKPSSLTLPSLWASKLCHMFVLHPGSEVWQHHQAHPELVPGVNLAKRNVSKGCGLVCSNLHFCIPVHQVVSYGQTIWIDLHQFHCSYVAGLRYGLHRSCVGHAEGLEMLGVLVG